jgi:20S proteasome alpha/beta subunit
MAALLWMCLLQGVASSSSSSSAAPWQSNSGTSVLEQEEYRDMGPTVFSPGGRLHSVERTVAAASSLQDTSSNLVLALACREGVVLVTTCNTSPHLDIIASVDVDNEDETALWMSRNGRHVAPIARIAPEIFMATGGNAVDSCILREKITRMAEATKQEHDGGMPLTASLVSCSGLARRVSDHLQSPTQTTGKAGRILAVRNIVVSFPYKSKC